MATTLVVDDTALAREAVALLLQHEGYRTIAAANGKEAWAVMYHDRPDLVLLDLMMPEMTGMELWAALARARPGVEQRMVFITGGTFTDRAREFLETTANAWLEKPFEAGTLRDTVADQMRRAREPASA